MREDIKGVLASAKKTHAKILESFPNGANNEMRKEGVFSLSPKTPQEFLLLEAATVIRVLIMQIEEDNR